MAKIKIDSKLFSRTKKVAKLAGYTNVNEFIIHIIEKELEKFESNEVDEKVAHQLRGLGYIE